MGGEKAENLLPEICLPGSPPRGRGKEGALQSGKHRHGITPAWAGKSKLALCTPSCPTDHPRAGREKNKELEGVWLPMGSPPRRRGKERSTALVGTPTRITPAWAGKSFQRARKIKERGDHPRVGGEKSGNGGVRPMWQGSPPRGRGKAHVLRPRCLRPGITPAWAGKRYTSTVSMAA